MQTETKKPKKQKKTLQWFILVLDKIDFKTKVATINTVILQ